MSNIYYPEEVERKVSLKEIVEAVEGTTYNISDGVIMNDYGYPVYLISLTNKKYKESIIIEVSFDIYTSYEQPMTYHEIHFYTDDGFDWAKLIEEKVKVKYHLINSSSHSDMTTWQDEEIGAKEWEEKTKEFEKIVKDNNLNIFKPKQFEQNNNIVVGGDSIDLPF